jgi:hypothetical protein
MPEIRATPAGERTFRVEATVDGRRHAWRVGVPPQLAAGLAADPESVAKATIAFLLEREPPGSILSAFDCSVVPGYFPDYEDELPRYLRQWGAH